MIIYTRVLYLYEYKYSLLKKLTHVCVCRGGFRGSGQVEMMDA